MIAQRQVDSKSNEITAFRPLLAPLQLARTVVTFDALLTQTEHARFLVEDKKAHYIAVVKGNHPTLQATLKKLPWRDVPCWTRLAPPATAATRSAGSRPQPSPGSPSRTRYYVKPGVEDLRAAAVMWDGLHGRPAGGPALGSPSQMKGRGR